MIKPSVTHLFGFVLQVYKKKSKELPHARARCWYTRAPHLTHTQKGGIRQQWTTTKTRTHEKNGIGGSRRHRRPYSARTVSELSVERFSAWLHSDSYKACMVNGTQETCLPCVRVALNVCNVYIGKVLEWVLHIVAVCFWFKLVQMRVYCIVKLHWTENLRQSVRVIFFK